MNTKITAIGLLKVSVSFFIGGLVMLVITMFFHCQTSHGSGPTLSPKPDNWSKWSPPDQKWSDWNGAHQYRTNLDTGLIEIRDIQ